MPPPLRETRLRCSLSGPTQRTRAQLAVSLFRMVRRSLRLHTSPRCHPSCVPGAAPCPPAVCVPSGPISQDPDHVERGFSSRHTDVLDESGHGVSIMVGAGRAGLPSKKSALTVLQYVALGNQRPKWTGSLQDRAANSRKVGDPSVSLMRLWHPWDP